MLYWEPGIVFCPSFCPSVDHCLSVCLSLLYSTPAKSRHWWCLIKWILTENLATRQRQIDEMNSGLWLHVPLPQQPIGIPPNYRGFPEATQETGAGRRPYFSPPPLGTRLVRHQSAPVKLGPPHQGESPLVLHTKPQLGALGQRCSSRLMYHSYKDSHWKQTFN